MNYDVSVNIIHNILFYFIIIIKTTARGAVKALNPPSHASIYHRIVLKFLILDKCM